MKFRVRSSSEVFRGRVFTVVNQDIELPHGRISRFNIVKHPGAVAVVPFISRDEVLLIRQLRPAAGGPLYEIVAGTREPGEAPKTTAGRELIEEVGYRAGRLTKIGEFFSAPGFCTELIHVYVARDLRPQTAERDSDEVIRPVRVSYRRALEMIETGRIRDAKTIAGLYLAKRN